MTRLLFLCGCLALGSAIAGCGTNPVSYPDGVIYGRWEGTLALSGSGTIGTETEDFSGDPVPFGITFAEDGVPDVIPPIGDDQGGFNVRQFMTPGDVKNSDLSQAGSGTTGTAKLTCVKAEFSESAMTYETTLEVDTQTPVVSHSLTTSTITAVVTGQVCHFTNHTVITGSGPFETSPGSGVFETKDVEIVLHAEGDLTR